MNEVRLDCVQTQAHLPLAVGGDLESPWAEAVQTHLRQCAACDQERLRLERALGSLDALRQPVPDMPSVWGAVRARLVEEGRLVAHEQAANTVPIATRPNSAVASATPRPWRRVAAWASLAAAAGLLWIGVQSLSQPAAPASHGVDAPAVAEALDADLAEQGQPALAAIDPSSDDGQSSIASEVLTSTGLRRADGEERLREHASPFLSNSPLVPSVGPRAGRGQSALAGDRELR